MMSDKPKILVVDDELGPRESLRMILNDRYEVITADSGAAAVEHVSSRPTDIVLLDIKMPGMDGIETLRRIKQMRPEVGVVMITAYASVHTAKDAMKHDALDYLIKPFSREDVNKAVAKGLTRREERLGSRRQIKNLVDQMRALTRVSSQVGSERGFLPALSTIVEESALVLSADGYAVCLSNGEYNRLSCVLSEGLSQKFIEDATAWGTLGDMESLPPDPVVICDSVGDGYASAIRDAMLKEGYRWLVLLPLLYGREILGTLIFCHRNEKVHSQRDLELAQAFAKQVTVVLKNNQLYESLESKATELSQKVAQLSILREISAAILGNLDLDVMLGSVTKKLKDEFGYDRANVSIADEGKDRQKRAWSGSNPTGPIGSTVSLSPVPPGVRCDPLEGEKGFRITSPIVIDSEPAGVLEVHTQRRGGEKELELIGMLSEYIAIAVRNSRLYREINEAKSYLESLINDAGDAIVSVNSEDVIISWNTAAERIFQYTKADVLEKSIWSLIPKSEYEKQKSLLLTYGQARSFETEGKRRDGTTIDIEVILSPIKGANGDIIGISAIIKDVTERNDLQQQLIHSEKQRALGIMSGGVAHNFNNVLTGVLGHAQLLQILIPQGKDHQMIHNSLKAIEKSAMDGAAIVRRMQEFTKVSKDRTAAPVDLNRVIEDSLSISKPRWKHEPEARNIKIDVRTEFDDIPLIDGNKSELGEILVNLIFNAVDAMPNGGEISIKTWTEEGWVYLSVSDTGIGMSEETKKRVFDPFFTTKGVKGQGLGMSVVHGIVKRHNGQIDIDSAEGEGTTFTIRFPIPEKVEKEVQREATPKKVAPARILFIEDEGRSREVLAKIVEVAGHKITLASSGAEGLEMLKGMEFDVLFTDLSMPGMNGWQVAERAKEIDPRIPIVLCTGWGVEVDQRLAEECGIDFIVAKPFEVSQILDVVGKAVELRRRSRGFSSERPS